MSHLPMSNMNLGFRKKAVISIETKWAILMVSADTTVTADMVISDYVRVLPWHTFQLPYDPENMLIMICLVVNVCFKKTMTHLLLYTVANVSSFFWNRCYQKHGSHFECDCWSALPILSKLSFFWPEWSDWLAGM